MKKFMVLLLISTHSMASLFGGVDGGGADQYSESFGSAWFLEGEKKKRVITYCLEKDEISFPISNEKIKSSLKKAFDTWKAYIDKYDIEYDNVEDSKSPTLNMVKDISYQSTCSQKTDLVLYLGKTNKIIDNIKKVMNKPAALTHRVNYKQSKGWSRGFIWINSNFKVYMSDKLTWNQNHNLDGLLLHEVGHIFGVEHQVGTVMEKNFTDKFINHDISIFPKHVQEDYKNSMTKINGTHILAGVVAFDGMGDNGGMMWLSGSKAEEETFELLFKRKPKGKIETSYYLLPRNKDKNFLDITLIVKEDGIEHILKGKVNIKEFSLFETDKKIFFRTRSKLTDNSINTTESGSGGMSASNVVGFFRTATGEKFNVIIEANLSPVLHMAPIGAKEGFYYNKSSRFIYFLNEGRKMPFFGKFGKYETSSAQKQLLRKMIKPREVGFIQQ